MLAPLVRVCSPHRISVLRDPHGCLLSLVHPQSIPPWASSFQSASQHLFVEHSPHPKQAFSKWLFCEAWELRGRFEGLF